MKRLNEIKMFNFRFSFLGYIIFLSFTLRKIFVSGSVFFAFFFQEQFLVFGPKGAREGGQELEKKVDKTRQINLYTQQ